MNKFFKNIRKAFADESAQGATEYILLLVIVVAVAVIFKDKIKEVISSKTAEVGSQIQGFSQ